MKVWRFSRKDIFDIGEWREGSMGLGAESWDVFRPTLR